MRVDCCRRVASIRPSGRVRGARSFPLHQRQRRRSSQHQRPVERHRGPDARRHRPPAPVLAVLLRVRCGRGRCARRDGRSSPRARSRRRPPSIVVVVAADVRHRVARVQRRVSTQRHSRLTHTRHQPRPRNGLSLLHSTLCRL